MTETFGARLQRARKLAGFRTQEVLADAVGVSGKTIRNWETGKVNPDNIDPNDREKLRALLGPFDDEGDSVEVAIRRADLDAWRKDSLMAEYRRHLHEQAREQAQGVARSTG